MVYYDKPGRILSMTRKHAGENIINYVDDYALPLTSDFSTPTKWVLFAKADRPLSQTDGANRWTRCFDHAHGRYRDQLGLKEQKIRPVFHIMPWVGRAMFGVEGVNPKLVRKKVGELLKNYAEITLPFFHELGFRQFFCGPHWRSDVTEENGAGNECCVHFLEYALEYGGEPALKHLCDAANRLDMEILVWIAMHMSTRSELYRRNPEWKIKPPGDEGPSGNALLDSMSLHSSFWKYVVDSLRRIRKNTGVHGVMFDTYHREGGLYPINRADPLLPPQAEELFRLQKALQRMGLINTIEAVGPFGISTWGFCTRTDARYHNLIQWYFGNEFAAYKTSFGGGFESIADGTISADQYYRMVANKCLMCLGVNTVVWKFDAKETNRRVGKLFTQPFRQANHDYNAVSKWMEHRTLLEKDRGVEWTSRDGKVSVLFSFADFRHRLPKKAGITDITAQDDLGTSGTIAAEKNHTYLIGWRSK